MSERAPVKRYHPVYNYFDKERYEHDYCAADIKEYKDGRVVLFSDYQTLEADLALIRQQLHEHAETIARLRTDLADATTELEKSKQWAVKLGAELDKGDSWAWIRGKFEKCGTHLKWFKPREDSLAGTRYEVMGWLHVLFAEASPKVYIDIAIEHQKKADDAERLLADATAQRDVAVKRYQDFSNEQGISGHPRWFEKEFDDCQYCTYDCLCAGHGEMLRAGQPPEPPLSSIQKGEEGGSDETSQAS